MTAQHDRVFREAKKERQVVFINYAMETFTPTQSGALATIIRECALVAQKEGGEPIVLTSRCGAQPYEDFQTLFVDPPRAPRNGLDKFVLRAERKVLGFRHMDHRGYVRRVIGKIREENLGEAALILQNDPELAVNLREHFPKARIVHWFQNQHGAKPWYRKRFGAAINAVAAVSEYTARWVEVHYDLPRGSVEIVHNGVNLDNFFPAENQPAGTPVVNFVGRTGIEKAPDLLLTAALSVSERCKDFAVQLLGSNHWDRFEMDDYQRKLIALSLELEKRGIETRRPGSVDRYMLPVLLRQAAIHVVPSRWEEPCALALLEGMASGLAVVASRTGGTPELLGSDGLLFARDNVQELTACLDRLLSDQELRRHYAHRARQRACLFSWQSTWRRLKALAVPER